MDYSKMALVVVCFMFASVVLHADTVKFKNFSGEKVWVYIKKIGPAGIDATVADFKKIVEPGDSFTESGDNISAIWALPYNEQEYKGKSSEELRKYAENLNLKQKLGDTTSVLSFDIDPLNKPYLYYGWFEVSRPFSVLSLSDVHVTDKRESENVSAVRLRNYMKGYISNSSKNVRGIIFVGDSAGGYGKADEVDAFKAIYFNPLAKLMQNNQGQVFLVPGNHDTYWENWYSPNQPSAMLKFIKNVYSDYIYRFNIGPVKFINLGLYASGTKAQKDTRNVTLLETDKPTLQWLQEILSTVDHSEPIVLMFHYPIHGDYSDWWHKSEKDSLYNAIKNYNVIAILVGHAHANKVFSFRGKCPVIQAALASFALLQFDPAKPTSIRITYIDTNGQETEKEIITGAIERDFAGTK